MAFRSAIPDFSLANSLYIGATVTFWGVDVDGNKDGTLPLLYANPTGPQTVGNPQVLDGEGKFSFPVYHEVPLIAEVRDVTGSSTDTGIIMLASSWGGDWQSGVLVQVNTFLRDPANLSIYAATKGFVTSGSIAGDVGAGNLVLVFQGEAATVASDAAEAAQASAAAAALSAANAAAVLAGAAQALGLSVLVPVSNDGTRPTPSGAQRAITWSSVRNRLEAWTGGVWGALVSLSQIGGVDLSTPPATGDGLVYNGVNYVPGPAGGGMYAGNSGTVGSRLGDIFRLNAQTLTANVTILGTQNAEAVGPLAIQTGVTLTVNTGGTLVIL